MDRHFFWLTIISLVLSGCSEASNLPASNKSDKKPFVAITWSKYEEGDDQNAIHYYIDGRDVGVGETAFSRLIQTLRSLPSGQKIYVYPDANVSLMLADATGAIDPTYPRMEWLDCVPFRKYDAAEKQMIDVCKERNHIIRYLPHEPITDESQNLILDADLVMDFMNR